MKLKWDCDKKPEALVRGDWFRTEHGFVEFDELIESARNFYTAIYYRESEAGSDRIKGACILHANGMLSVYRSDQSSIASSDIRAALRRIVSTYEVVVVGDDRRAENETEGAKSRARDLDVAKTWLKMDERPRIKFTNWVRQELLPRQIKEGMRLIDSISGELYPVVKDSYKGYNGWVISYQDPTTNQIHTIVKQYADVRMAVEVKM